MSQIKFFYLREIEPQLEILKLLLSHPEIDVNKSLGNRTTPLMVASRNGNWRVLRVLLAHVEIEVNFATYEGKTALFYAFTGESFTSHTIQKDVVEILLQCPSVDILLKDEEDKTARDYAESNERHDVIRAFESRHELKKIEHTCCSDIVNEGMLRAAEAGDLKWIEIFVVCPQLDINLGHKYGYTPLYLASKEGHSHVVQALLKIPSLDVNIEVNFKTPLMIAAKNDHANVSTLLLASFHIDVNKKNTGDGGSALIIASESGKRRIVKLLLLSHQIDSNLVNFYGESALKKAAMKGHLREVKLLLRCPKTKVSNLDATEFVNKYERKVHKEMVEAFQLHGSLLQLSRTCCIDTNRNLIKAAILGDTRSIRGLQECPDADINTVDIHGRASLHLATYGAYTDMVEVLLNNPMINVNQNGIKRAETAFSIASGKGHLEILKLLIMHSHVDYGKGWCTDEWALYQAHCSVSSALSDNLTSTTNSLG